MPTSQELLAKIRQKSGKPLKATPVSAGLDLLALMGHMGISDEVSGLVTGLSRMAQGGDFKTAYNIGLEKQRKRIAGARERSGLGGMAAEMLPGLVPVGLAARGATAAVQSIPPLMRMVRGGTAGAAGGATMGFAEGEGGAESRLSNATIPAAAGGVLGAAGPLAGAGIGKLTEKGARGLTALKARVRPELVDPLKHLLEDDLPKGTPTPEVPMVAQIGPHAAGTLSNVVEDIGGRMDDIIAARRFGLRRKVPSEAELRERISERSRAEAAGFHSELDRQMGPAEGIQATKARLDAESKPAVAKAYDEAYATPIDYDTPAGYELADFLQSGRIPAKAWKRANELIRAEGTEGKQLIYEILDDNKLKMMSVPNLRQIDYLKRAMDDLIEGETDNISHKATQLGRAYGRTKAELLELADELKPEYADARAIAAAPKRATDAMESAYKGIMQEGMTADEFQALVSRVKPEDRQWLEKGARSAIEEMMTRARDVIVPKVGRTGYQSAARLSDPETVKGLTQLTSGRLREKMRTVLGPERAEELFKRVDSAMTAYATEASTLPNIRKETREMLDEFFPQRREGVLGQAMRGDVLGAMQTGISNVFGWGLADDVVMSDLGKGQLAGILTEPSSKLKIDTLRKAPFPRAAGRRARSGTERTATALSIPAGLALADQERLEEIVRRLGY